MVYMIVENFRAGDPVPVYRRFRDQGRLAPVMTSAEAAAAIAPRL